MKSLSLYAIGLFLLMSCVAFAQDAYQLIDSKISVAGTSTLHDWESEVGEVNLQASIEMKEGKLQAISSLSLRIPAKSIKSTKGRIMDNKTYEALKAEDHPNIRFKLTASQIKDNNQLIATGQLAIAGSTKTVSFPVMMKRGIDDSITFSGSYSLLMSDYGMEAPTALMGSIKTGDQVTVKFSCTLAVRSARVSSK